MARYLSGIVLLATTILVHADTTSQWSIWGGNSDQTWSSPYSGPSVHGNTAWITDVATLNPDSITLDNQGRLYINDVEGLRAFSQETGKQLWMYTFDQPFYGTHIPPTVTPDGNGVLVQTYSMMALVSTKTGKEIWKQDTIRWSKSNIADDGIYTYWLEGGDGQPIGKLDLATGNPIWEIKYHNLRHSSLACVPLITDHTMIVADVEGNIQSIDRATGKLLQRQTFPQGMFQAPCPIYAEQLKMILVLDPISNNVTALDSTSLKILWHTHAASTIPTVFTVDSQPYAAFRLNKTGNLMVCSLSRRDCIPTAEFTTATLYGLFSDHQVADNAGRVYVANANSVYIFDTTKPSKDGAPSQTIVYNPEGDHERIGHLSIDVATGNLYVLIESRIIKIV